MNKYISKKNKGFTLVELIITLSILTIALASVFSIFSSGNQTFSFGVAQSGLQSDIRLASDVIRDKVRYATYFEIMSSYPSSPDASYNYIYLADNKKSIKYKALGISPVDIITATNAVTYDLVFSQSTSPYTGSVIAFSNAISSSSLKQLLELVIEADDVSKGKHFEVDTSIDMMNLNTVMVDLSFIDAPAASPAEGNVSYGASVTLSTTETGASIYFTTNGTDPTLASTLYTQAISIVNNTTIKAITVKDGVSSTISEYIYTLSEKVLAIINSIDGELKTGTTVSINYTYLSLTTPAIKQGLSKISWYVMSSNTSPTASTPATVVKYFSLTDVTSLEFALINAYKNKYLFVTVEPINAASPTPNRGDITNPFSPTNNKIHN